MSGINTKVLRGATIVQIREAMIPQLIHDAEIEGIRGSTDEPIQTVIFTPEKIDTDSKNGELQSNGGDVVPV
jgi:hypothetical protein